MIIKVPDKNKHPKTLGFVEYPMWIRKMLNKKDHDGIDYACKEDEAFPALFPGIVIWKGQDKDGHWYVFVYLLTENKNVFIGTYRHYKKLFVKIGDRVSINQTLGLGGKLGHIHFQVNGAINPEEYQYEI
jgi:murein DD-endopeptidase MepM/ murein hydrolase activator NlpD